VRAATLDELQDLLDRPWAPPPRPDGDGRPPKGKGNKKGKGNPKGNAKGNRKGNRRRR
jgi:hypothetical protein